MAVLTRAISRLVQCCLIAAFVAAYLCSGAMTLYAQQSDGPVDSARTSYPILAGFALSGNRLTKSEVILRELTLHVGDTLTPEGIEYMKSRLYGLGLFNRVHVSYPPIDSTVLLIELEERWYIWVYPVVGIAERDWSKWYYGFGVRHDNFRGRNERVMAQCVFGYNPVYSFSYQNPWIFGEAELYSETSGGYTKVQDKSAQARPGAAPFHTAHLFFNQTLGKRFSPFFKAGISVGADNIKVDAFQSGRTVSANGNDFFMTLSASARYDTRDLAEYPLFGMFAAAAVTKYGIGFGQLDAANYSFDLRVFKQLFRGWVLGGRTFARFIAGPDIPDYLHQYFGFDERIRGHFDERLEGENILGAFAELRIPIIAPFFLHLENVPIPEFSTWRLGLYGTLFYDAGAVWYNRTRPPWNHAPHGFGAGLNFLLPYSMVFRIDHAWNEYGRGEWIFDMFAAF
jgi:outer membrane protein assembly factor BamA